ncbi:MAG TPA: alpha-amylase family glycosyl hydrolase [Longimicrobium sp.]|jgi:glycosidase|uniref:alpha-amylase family glycosyl hydrolase n=1 Tax=Longimicrobium sp. TaxID=2029185 RepID=UPI002EDAFBAA
MADWDDAVFYHIYPLGLCGAPARNDFGAAPVPRLAELHGWIAHMRGLGATALYLGPLFESTAHGYDTADYYHVDRRLGTDDTLKELAAALRDAGIRLVLDGVFHHVGRDFWAFRDLREKGEASPYRDWFHGVDFSRRSPAGDAFGYDGWRGHYDLVKLNLGNPAVREHLFGAIRSWVQEFGIDGLRLDVAEDIDPDFLRALAEFTRELKPDFWLLGEAIHGDYRRLAQTGLHSVTNYEVYKGLYSSHNDRNYFEIAHSLQRQFGDGGVYRGLPLYNFADNHDVNRVATTLREPAHLDALYTLLFTIPGVPSVYYGSEWGITGARSATDDHALRPRLKLPDAAHQAPRPGLARWIARVAEIRSATPALRRGEYRQLHVSHEQFAFARTLGGDVAIVAVNAADAPCTLDLPAPAPDGTAFVDRSGDRERFQIGGGRLRVEIAARGARILARG